MHPAVKHRLIHWSVAGLVGGLIWIGLIVGVIELVTP